MHALSESFLSTFGLVDVGFWMCFEVILFPGALVAVFSLRRLELLLLVTDLLAFDPRFHFGVEVLMGLISVAFSISRSVSLSDCSLFFRFAYPRFDLEVPPGGLICVDIQSISFGIASPCS